MEVFKVLLLVFLVVCAVSVSVTRRLLTSVIIFMCYSLVMSVVWVLMQSPDLAITEAAVGAGITSILFFVTLKKIRMIDTERQNETEQEEEAHAEQKPSESEPPLS